MTNQQNTAPPVFPTAIAGHTAIVTGGARGFGLGIARRLADAGCRVILWDRSFDGFDETAAGFTPLLRQVLNIADASEVTQAFTEALAAAGQIEILVNNAGINGPVLPSWEYPLDAWRQVLGIDLNGVFHGCRAAIPHMLQRGYGRIVNIASIAGKEGNALGSAYAAAKGGVIAFSKSVAKELAGSGVLVNCIAPAMAETDLLKEMTAEFIAAMKAKIPMGRFLHVDEVAELVAWVASPACSFTTGFTFDLTGGRATY
jgi:NAD(P)-dependent dehydrogenase (short-subunit alcohol dehydrogenase family)